MFRFSTHLTGLDMLSVMTLQLDVNARCGEVVTNFSGISILSQPASPLLLSPKLLGFFCNFLQELFSIMFQSNAVYRINLAGHLKCSQGQDESPLMCLSQTWYEAQHPGPPNAKCQ